MRFIKETNRTYSELSYKNDDNDISFIIDEVDLNKVITSLQSLFPEAPLLKQDTSEQTQSKKRNLSKSMSRLSTIDDINNFGLSITIAHYKNYEDTIAIYTYPKCDIYRDLNEFEKAQSIRNIERINII